LRRYPVVMALVRRLIRSGAAAAEDIGVITPYSAQVGVLRDLRAADDGLAKLEVSTVDGFQAGAYTRPLFGSTSALSLG
jgi:ATP-dependent RNA/DNA helicase IGHMBP2